MELRVTAFLIGKFVQKLIVWLVVIMGKYKFAKIDIYIYMCSPQELHARGHVDRLAFVSRLALLSPP